MSFRDFTPGGQPPRPGFEGAQNQNGAYPQPHRPGKVPQPQPSFRRAASNNHHGRAPSPNPPQQTLQFSRSRSENTYQNHHRTFSTSSLTDDRAQTHNNPAQNLLVQQREEEYAMRAMREREEELRDINRKMHVVNQIYKDLGEVVDEQQDQIDEVENQFGGAADATRRGLEQLEKANKTHRKVAEADADNNNAEGPGKWDRFFLFQYITKSANELSKLISVCGGAGSAEYVEGESWTKK